MASKKYYFEVIVEAEPCIDSPSFPEHGYAQQELSDVFRNAIVYLRYMSVKNLANKDGLSSGIADAYESALDKSVTKAENIASSVRFVKCEP